MTKFRYPFSFQEDSQSSIIGELILHEPEMRADSAYRNGLIKLENGKEVEISLCHSKATSAFIYTSEREVCPEYWALLGFENEFGLRKTVLPGQLILGAERTALVQQGIFDLLDSEGLTDLVNSRGQENIITLPVLREGVKYGLVEKIYEKYRLFLNEVVSDAHHQQDDSEAIYKRRVTRTIFKDADLTEKGKEAIDTVFVADSIASGTVILGVMKDLGERIHGVKHLELIAPLATVRGLARIAYYSQPETKVRAHVFETLLNALAPDFYYSAHFPESQFHIDHEAQAGYRAWWGEDAERNQIADTACAGYGWSEAFFAPEMQVQMINQQLQERHGLSLEEIFAKKLR